MYVLIRKSTGDGTVDIFAELNWDVLKAKLIECSKTRNPEIDIELFDNANAWEKLRNGHTVFDGYFLWNKYDEAEHGFYFEPFKGLFIDLREVSDFG
jgi:hypothetical protein